MTRGEAEQRILELFSRIESLPGALRIPHGFELRTVTAAEEDDLFPEGSRHWETTAVLSLPVVYSYTTATGARLPADLTNLNRLRAAVEQDELESAPRTRVCEWIVEPDEAPEPPDPWSGEGHGLAGDLPNWTVTAVFELR